MPGTPGPGICKQCQKNTDGSGGDGDGSTRGTCPGKCGSLVSVITFSNFMFIIPIEIGPAVLILL